ncbi:urea transport system ATP-binding protein [Dyadobacter sp. BE34]|uniref:Urea transport system ATP-binding protein n=1 Tax=Dyadobacter fermentans TaxID=94254 RepID=A0ABU1R0K1_9BACT|nr:MULTISPECIES: urea ABC transporter ATP-binding protein UrtD [Dyadobacter]MDR6806931.1 urea transport system ATP-binding protein [Dyadobacter fermentans]MDR7044673.1 urea transport system ATP-binding protein [Dyadobacter sp. BE242]MDR7198983.1 urea transport system ATP-binding protein [Dyadobacter sp. BE34]MDR7216945.1 urea transport system ATP-binding protein [Dyadobacter sp. BE31]MDR7263529.1 urea transport system ATP-binding protein [Dyadobacter sp. BE32]
MLLTVKNLSVSFGGVHALNLSRFNLLDRELRVIIGPNGAGKSTYLDILCGKTKADTGEVHFDGHSVLGKSEVRIADMGIGRKFQKPSIFPSLTVYDNMLLAFKMNKGIFASLFFKPNQEMDDRIHEVALKVGLQKSLGKVAGELSHGQKQWLEIAIVVLQDPKLMLIDEPAAGMSDEETEKTGELLLQLARQHAIIVIEHDMKFVEQIAQDLVTVLVRGKLLMEGTFDEVRNDQRVIDSYLGRANVQLENF